MFQGFLGLVRSLRSIVNWERQKKRMTAPDVGGLGGIGSWGVPQVVEQAAVRQHTLKGKGDPHWRAGWCSPLLQLPLLEGVMGLSTTLKWSRVVGVVYMMLLPRVHFIRLVCVLVGGGPCTHNSTFRKGCYTCSGYDNCTCQVRHSRKIDL